MSGPDEDTIVVGIDGSECSRLALAWAITEAKRSGRHLRLIHFWSWTSDIHILTMPTTDIPDARRSGRTFLDRAVALAKKDGVTATTHLAEGSPAGDLATAARGAAMLVVGSHGRSPLTSAFLGSVSRACLRSAVGPVVVIPAPSGSGQGGQRREVTDLQAAGAP